MEDGIKASMKEAGIDLSILLPVVTKPSQFQSINLFASRYTEAPLLSLGGIHPDSENYKDELKQLKEMGFKGIKFHPDYQTGVYIDDIRYKRIISYASELDMIVVTHAGFDPAYPDETHGNPDRIINMYEELKPERLVLAHMGGYQRWDDVEKYLVGLPVWFDTGVVFQGQISDEQFVRIAKKHGTDRILFGTDSPWACQKEYVEHIRSLPFTDIEKENIFHNNAEKLLQIKVPNSMK
jgi:predicted TIM-barrel fold metal-dependent hydrolase